jgi:OmpA-OmpF porin, OOP family
VRTYNARRAWTLVVAVVLSVAALTAQDPVKMKGLIVGRDGATMIVRGDAGNVNVMLADSTTVEAVKGRFGVRKDTLGLTALIPGLPVEVEGVRGADGQVTANTVKFKADDLKTAHEIQAGLAPTSQQLYATQKQVQANQTQIQQTDADQAALSKRFGELGDYDVKGNTTVYFAVNSTELSARGKEDLKALSVTALALKGYMIQVAGYTDATGNADQNQELSDRRAEAVITYLQQSCSIPLFRVLAPAAMGISNPAGTNDTPQGQAENRRVVTKILVNRGLAG